MRWKRLVRGFVQISELKVEFTVDHTVPIQLNKSVSVWLLSILENMEARLNINQDHAIPNLLENKSVTVSIFENMKSVTEIWSKIMASPIYRTKVWLIRIFKNIKSVSEIWSRSCHPLFTKHQSIGATTWNNSHFQEKKASIDTLSDLR
jgi:hypothetical protein